MKTALPLIIATALAALAHAQPSNPAWVEAQDVLDRNRQAREHRAVMEKLDDISSKASSSNYEGYTVPLLTYAALVDKYNALLQTIEDLRRENENLKWKLAHPMPQKRDMKAE